MISKQTTPVRYWFLSGLLVAMLLTEVALFAWSGIYDVRVYGKEQVISALLRFLIVALNVVALLQMYPGGPLAGFIRRIRQHLPRNAHQARRPRAITAAIRAARNQQRRRPGVSAAPRVTNRNPWHYPIVLLSQAAALPMLFIPIWIDLHSPTLDMEWLALAFALFVCIVVMLVSAAVYGHVNFGWVALGTLLPLLGFAQWSYMTFYKPVHERPRVDISTRLEKINSSRGTTRVRGVVTLKNNGAAPAESLGAIYVVSGHRAESAEGMTAQDASATLDLSEPNRRHFGKFASLLSFDDLLATGESLAPGETRTSSFVFDARDSGQAIVRLTAYISMSTPTGDLDPGTCSPAPPEPNVCTRTDFAPTSLARKELGDEPFAHTIVHFDAMLTKTPAPPYMPTAFGTGSQKTPFAYTVMRLDAMEATSAAAPYLSTAFGAGNLEQGEKVQDVDPLIRDQFTQSITELRLDP
ncbi:hypothetical protein [Streptomyces sp. NPDC006463]|uniref:hypothetical protein n=1 Tax=Streptomyces sp. NPDC006463 TaxID=3364746 RepID=UPI00368F5D19